MKTKFRFILSLTILATLPLIGCKNMSPQQNILLQGGVQAAVTGAATGATAAVVRNNPQSVPDFQAGEVALNELAGSGVNLSTNDIDAVLKQQGVTNPAVQGIVLPALLIAQPLFDSATNAVQSQQFLAESLTWAANGIALGIPIGEALAAAKQSSK